MSEILFFTAGVIVAALFAIAAGLGVIIARTYTPRITKEPPKQAHKPTDEEIRKAKRLQKEVINMLSYNGTPQEEIHID